MSRKSKYATGTIHNTPYGKLRVVDFWGHAKSRRKGFSNTRAIVEFLDTGYVCNVQVQNIGQGKVKDMRRPSVYGVGYLDMDIRIPSRESGSEIRKAYDLWANMLRRCYGGYEDSYKGVTVDKRWHSFRNFLNSIQELEGYDLWLADSSMHLDKDIKVPGSNVYSKDTCKFVTASENISDSSNRRWGNV